MPNALANAPKIITEVSNKVRDIVKLVRRSVKASDKLKKLQNNDGKCPLKFILDMPVRWNSTFMMLERFLDLEEYAYSSTSECNNRPEMLLTKELQLIKDIVEIMRPIKDVITEISSEHYHPTASTIIPLVQCTRLALQDMHPETEGGSIFLTILLDGIKKAFAGMEENTLLRAACILDPRFKRVPFQSQSAATAGIKLIDLELRKLNNSVPIIVETPKPEKKVKSIWDCP